MQTVAAFLRLHPRTGIGKNSSAVSDILGEHCGGFFRDYNRKREENELITHQIFQCHILFAKDIRCYIAIPEDLISSGN